MAATIFEKYGGFGPISRLVMDFYDRVLESERLAPYFENVDMRRQIEHQTTFIASIMGGPTSHTNEALRQVHAHLKIDQASFDELTGILRETMVDFGFEPEDVEQVMRQIESRKTFILGA